MFNRFIYLILFSFALIPGLVQAYTVSYDGCWEKSNSSNEVTVNLQGMECAISLTSDTSETVSFTIEHLDPDYFDVDNYDTITRATNSLTFTKTIDTTTETINIAPWYTPDDFYFVGMSDPQPSSEQWYDPAHEAMLKQTEKINPYFTIIAGDLTYGDSDESSQRDNFDGFLYIMEEELNTPWFVVPGNHDIEASMDLYQEYLGPSYYSFDFAGTHFMGMSTEEDGEENSIEGDQFTWLQNDLNNSSAETKIAYWHRPLVPPDWASYAGWTDDTQANLVAGALSTAGVDLVLNGHSHGYDYELIDNHDFASVTNNFYQQIIAGAGATLYQPEAYNFFVLLYVSDQGIEYTVIPKDDFTLSKSFTDNDGSVNEVTVSLENNGNIDLPFVRNKFKLKDATRLMAKDDSGNYYALEVNEFDDYVVAYLDTDLDQDDSEEITVSPATIIHQDVTNTIYSSDSTIAYSSWPENEDTETTFTVTPSKGRITLETETWELNDTYQKKWTASSLKGKNNVTYNVGDLEANARYKLKVDGTKYGEYDTDADGKLEFSYKHKKNTTTSFDISNDGTDPKDYSFAISDASSGNTTTTNSRTINVAFTAGDYSGTYKYIVKEKKKKPKTSSKNWESLPESCKLARGNGKKTVYAWIKDNNDNISKRISDSIILRQEPTTPSQILTIPASEGGSQVKTFNKNGTNLSSFFAYREGLEGAWQTKWADLNGDDQLEIITLPGPGISPHLRAFNQNSKVIDSLYVYDETFKKGVNLARGDIDGKGKDELVATPQEGAQNAKIIKYNKKAKLKILRSQAIYPTLNEGFNVALGDIDKNNKDELIFSPQAEQAPLKIYRYNKKKNKLKLIKKKNIPGYADGYNLAVGDIDANGRDEIILVDENGLVNIYRYNKKKNKLKKIKTKKIFGVYQGGIKIKIGDIDANGKDEIIFIPDNGRAIEIYRYKKKKNKLKLVDKIRPYGTSYNRDINISLVDVNDDEKPEIVTAPAQGSANIRVYRYKSKGDKLKLNNAFWAYGNTFTGGVNLAIL